MEFVTFEEAWSLLRRLGVTKVTDAPKEMRFELADSPSVVVIDVAADDHPEIKSWSRQGVEAGSTLLQMLRIPRWVSDEGPTRAH